MNTNTKNTKKPTQYAEPKAQSKPVIAEQTHQVPAAFQQRGYDLQAYNTFTQIIWPEAKDQNVVALALDYCKARNLDPMKKPVNIVPMWDGK